MAPHARNSSLIAALIFALALGAVQAQFTMVKLPYALSTIEPAIDNATMNFHYGVHYSTYINNTNAALANTTSIPPSSRKNLTGLISSVTSLLAPLNVTVRNQGGGAWNHAMYFLHLAPPGSNVTQQSAISPLLRTALVASFGSVDNAIANVTAAGGKVFGSGWSWLCYTGGAKPLVVVTTPNQDNPLMGTLPSAPPLMLPAGVQRCTPVLGLDVWEHAYYLKWGPKRASYIGNFWTAVNWQRVSDNYAAAVRGDIEAAVNPKGN